MFQCSRAKELHSQGLAESRAKELHSRSLAELPGCELDPDELVGLNNRAKILSSRAKDLHSKAEVGLISTAGFHVTNKRAESVKFVSHLKYYIKLVAGPIEGVDKDCQGPGLHLALVKEVSKTTDHLPVEDVGDEECVLDRDLVQVVTHENLWVGLEIFLHRLLKKCVNVFMNEFSSILIT